MERIINFLEKINTKDGSPIITLVSLALLLATSYYTSVSAARAIENAVAGLEGRVLAIEEDRKSVPQWRQEFEVIKERVKREEEDIKEIKQDVKDIRNFLFNK